MSEFKDFFGHKGRLISASKGRYSHDNPRHLIVFNSDVLIDDKKVWYGDIDITLELEKLREAARDLNKTICVAHERGGSQVISVSPQGTIEFDLEYFEEEDGTIKIKEVKREPYDPHKAMPVKLKKDEITAEVKFDLDQIKPKDGKELSCPFITLVNLLKVNHGCLGGESLYSGDIFLSPTTYRKVSEYTLKWLLMAEPDLKGDDYGIKKNFSMFSLCYSPNVADEDFIKDNCVYYRGNKKCKSN